MNLRKRLFLMLLMTSLIPLIIFSVVSVFSFFSKSKQYTYQQNQDKLEIVKSEIDGMLEKNFTTLHTAAKQTAIRNFDLQEAKNILVNAANVNPDLVITLDDIQGQQVAKSTDDGLTNVAEREFFQQAIQGREEYVSDVLVSKVTGLLNVVIATPVRDMNNNIVGILQASTELSKVSDFVTELSEGGSNVYVLSRQGTVLAHPNRDYVDNQEDFSQLEFVQTGFTSQADATLSAKNIQGEDVIVSYSLNELSGWLIVVETPVSVAMASAYGMLNVSLIVLIAAAIIIGLLGLYFSRRFTKPLLDLSSIIQKIASGDLKDFDVKVKSNDEIGVLYDNLKTMNQNLRTLIGNIQTTASSLAAHSLQLSSTTKDSAQSLNEVVMTMNELAEGNGNQAIMIQNTTDAITKVHNIISEATMKTEIEANKAKESLELAKEGKKALEVQGEKIEENNNYTHIVGESIHQLAIMADEIRNIIGEINNISGQTNLLALNASIEAARAGEAGRGFAVVAEEIRQLAEQSRNFTGKIENIVSNINERISETDSHMIAVKESVVVMESAAEDTKESFNRIFDSITELAQISRNVSASLEEINHQTHEVTIQATNISAVVEQASAGMEEISASSQEQLASVETIARSAEQLESVASELIDQVNQFKVE